MPEALTSFRTIVADVDAALAFYTGHLGFAVGFDARPAFAAVTRGGLQVWLSGPKSSAGRTLADGRVPAPGGWNRIVLQVADIAAEVERLKAAGLAFRGPIVKGPGGSQILLDDPSGNPSELFQPAG